MIQAASLVRPQESDTQLFHCEKNAFAKGAKLRFYSKEQQRMATATTDMWEYMRRGPGE